MDCSLPGSSVHGIFQARVLEWGAIAFSKKLSKIILINLKHVFCSREERWGGVFPEIIDNVYYPISRFAGRTPRKEELHRHKR